MATGKPKWYNLNTMKTELMEAEGFMANGDKREALHFLSEYLKAEDASHLSQAVERASRGNVGGFSLDDIMAMAELDEDQAELVMEDLADNFDAEMGMSWEQIKDTIDDMFPSARKRIEV